MVPCFTTAHGEVEEGIAGTEEAATQPVKEEEEAEDILTFEEFKQRRMMEVQLHQQEELKNAGKCSINLESCVNIVVI